MPRTNGAIPIDKVQHAPGVIHASVVESVATIPPLGSLMLSRCPHTGQKCGKPTVLIIRSAHLRACMPPQPSCLPFPLPLGSPRQPSQKQRSNASLIGPSGIRPSKNARVLWRGNDSPTRGKLLEMAVALGVARYPESYENLGPLLLESAMLPTSS